MSYDILLEMRKAAEDLAGAKVLSISKAGSGANSHVLRVDTTNQSYALKCYPARPADQRPRALVEWETLTFLQENNVTAAPRPVARDPTGRYLLMDWIEGSPIDPHTGSDIDDAARFIGNIFRLSAVPNAKLFPLASEACLSAAEILRQIERRLTALSPASDVRSFVNDHILGPLEKYRRETGSAVNCNFELDSGLRRLIPADFGFHNALRRPNGRLCYLDFDYFGWDDPVKLTADFVLHPGMSLTHPDRLSFIDQVTGAVTNDPGFQTRLRKRLELYAIRWALILLNPFRTDRASELPADQSARDSLFADRDRKAMHVLTLAASMV